MLDFPDLIPAEGAVVGKPEGGPVAGKPGEGELLAAVEVEVVFLELAESTRLDERDSEDRVCHLRLG